MEFAYYSSKKFKIVCAYCGNNDCVVDEELKKDVQTVLPLCQDCVSAGKQPITHGKFRGVKCTSDCPTSSKKNIKRIHDTALVLFIFALSVNYIHGLINFLPTSYPIFKSRKDLKPTIY